MVHSSTTDIKMESIIRREQL